MLWEFLLPIQFGKPKMIYINPQFILESDTGIVGDRGRKIRYGIFLNDAKVGYAEVEYLQNLQHLLIHKLFIEEDFQRKEIGTNFVRWLIANTTYLVGTSYEWEAAYGFWHRMRERFKDRMLPPPA